jgi:hypothetical protein
MTNLECCKRPQLDDMSYIKYSASRSGHFKGEPRTHIYCHKCGAHLFGKPGKEVFTTKQEWRSKLENMKW